MDLPHLQREREEGRHPRRGKASITSCTSFGQAIHLQVYYPRHLSRSDGPDRQSGIPSTSRPASQHDCTSHAQLMIMLSAFHLCRIESRPKQGTRVICCTPPTRHLLALLCKFLPPYVIQHISLKALYSLDTTWLLFLRAECAPRPLVISCQRTNHDLPLPNATQGRT